MGRERPRLPIAKAAPGPPAGSLTPHVSLWVSGRALTEIVSEMRAILVRELDQLFPSDRDQECEREAVLFYRPRSLSRRWYTVAPASIVREHLGASRLRSLRSPLTRP